MALDKTGTLTEGRPEVTDLVVREGFDDGRGAGAGRLGRRRGPSTRSGRPSSRRRGAGAALPSRERFEADPGYGVSGTVDGREVAVGADG